jgi:hypothetical protein
MTLDKDDIREIATEIAQQIMLELCKPSGKLPPNIIEFNRIIREGKPLKAYCEKYELPELEG